MKEMLQHFSYFTHTEVNNALLYKDNIQKSLKELMEQFKTTDSSKPEYLVKTLNDINVFKQLFNKEKSHN